MEAGDPDIGTGVTLTFASGIIAKATNISWGGVTRPSVDSTYLGSSTARSFIPGDLYDAGELTIEFQLEPDVDWSTPLAASAATVTVAFPAGGGGANMSWSASGFLTGLEMNTPLEEMMTGTATVKLTSSITFDVKA